jgi:hypothetical protein
VTGTSCACSRVITPFQLDALAKAPWTSTTVGVVSDMSAPLVTKGSERAAEFGREGFTGTRFGWRREIATGVSSYGVLVLVARRGFFRLEDDSRMLPRVREPRCHRNPATTADLT